MLAGGRGDDVENGGAGDDDLEGNPGDDRLTGGPGVDRLVAGAGNDRVFARDGRRDHISCGTGDDTVTADRTDAVARSCEHVHRG
jgi:Ca2+-binding RTX toxin-like protein